MNNVDFENAPDILDIAKKLQERYYAFIGSVNLDSIYFTKMIGYKSRNANKEKEKHVVKRISCVLIKISFLWQKMLPYLIKFAVLILKQAVVMAISQKPLKITRKWRMISSISWTNRLKKTLPFC